VRESLSSPEAKSQIFVHQECQHEALTEHILSGLTRLDYTVSSPGCKPLIARLHCHRPDPTQVAGNDGFQFPYGKIDHIRKLERIKVLIASLTRGVVRWLGFPLLLLLHQCLTESTGSFAALCSVSLLVTESSQLTGGRRVVRWPISGFPVRTAVSKRLPVSTY
jgi:hypothetical protein